mmetsp:Transcript_48768/g.118003  ORF Transcript_48768/g.118003 Transcript_48768/m.118003 type:complete len:111 (+) Transcript_48768:1296-1628(+)
MSETTISSKSSNDCILFLLPAPFVVAVAILQLLPWLLRNEDRQVTVMVRSSVDWVQPTRIHNSRKEDAEVVPTSFERGSACRRAHVTISSGGKQNLFDENSKDVNSVLTA